MTPFIIAEIGNALKIKSLQNKYFSTTFAILPAMMLTMLSMPDPITGNTIQTVWVLWPIFGASNQMLAALTLMIITLYFFDSLFIIFNEFL